MEGAADIQSKPPLPNASIDLTDLSDDDDTPQSGVVSASTAAPGVSHPGASTPHATLGPPPNAQASSIPLFASTVAPSPSSASTPTQPSVVATPTGDSDIQITGSNFPSASSSKQRGPIPAGLFTSRPMDNTTLGAMAQAGAANGDGASSFYSANGMLQIPSGAGPVSSGSNGVSVASAIDLTKQTFPSPPPAPDNKRTLCIGAVQSRAMVLYPSPAIYLGEAQPLGAKEKFHLINYLGAELIKVKLKVSRPRPSPCPDRSLTSSYDNQVPRQDPMSHGLRFTNQSYRS